MKYPLKISTAPTTEPLTTQEAKDFFREDRSVEDSLIDQFVVASRKALERHTGYHLVDTEFKMYLKDFIDVKLPKKPLKTGSVSIEYVDESSVAQTLSTDKYNVHEVDSPVEIEFLDNLPDLDEAEDTKYPVIITFTVGYGTATSGTKVTAIPGDWKSVVGLVALILWKRDIPQDSFEDFNPLNLGVVRFHLQDYMIGRFK